jgi:hypothetical protein
MNSRLFWVLTLLIGRALYDTSHAQPNQVAAEKPDTHVQTNSFESILSTLAGERYTLAARRGRPPILSAHQWTENQSVLKYTDHDYTLVSVPVLVEDWSGMCEFFNRYNVYHVRDADQKVRAGNYPKARKMYEVLMHADSCGGLRKDILERLKLLTQLERGEARETNKVFSEYENLGTIPDLAQIDGLKAIVVTNLLTIQLPKKN